MPRRPFGSKKKDRPGMLQLVMAVILLMTLALGAMAATVFLFFPCPCKTTGVINRELTNPSPPPPEAEEAKP